MAGTAWFCLEQQLSLCISLLSQLFKFILFFLRNFVCIWPLKFINNLGKITQCDTRYIGGFGCDWALSLNQPLERASKKTCKLYIFVMMQQWPDQASDIPRCEWKSWISDRVQQLVVLQMRCTDVKPLWENEREKAWSSWITHVFSDDWLNLLVCVDLFTHLTYMLYSINVCRNFPHYKLESCGIE